MGKAVKTSAAGAGHVAHSASDNEEVTTSRVIEFCGRSCRPHQRPPTKHRAPEETLTTQFVHTQRPTRWDSNRTPPLENPPLPRKPSQYSPVRAQSNRIRSPRCAHCAHLLFLTTSMQHPAKRHSPSAVDQGFWWGPDVSPDVTKSRALAGTRCAASIPSTVMQERVASWESTSVMALRLLYSPRGRKNGDAHDRPLHPGSTWGQAPSHRLNYRGQVDRSGH